MNSESQRAICTPMFIAELVTRAKTWKPTLKGWMDNRKVVFSLKMNEQLDMNGIPAPATYNKAL